MTRLAASGKSPIGRESELAVAARSLAGITSGPLAIVLRGEAGIGKSTIWQSAVDEAASGGWRILTSRAGVQETPLSFAGLTDLLGHAADDVLADLPAPQRDALEVALLRAAPKADPPDSRSVGMAVLGALRWLAGTSPVLVAIDDAQWLDGPTIAALRFAIRRLTDERLAVLVAVRGAETSADPLELSTVFRAERLTLMEIGPLARDDIARLLRARLDLHLPRPALTQVHRASAGNPFYALEIGRALLRSGALKLTGEPLPLPTNLRAVVQARLETLSDEALQVLLIAAATARPTLGLVRRVLADPDLATGGVAQAERAEIIVLERDSLRFTHPLLASTVYSSMPASERRNLHRRLGDVVDDAEERARHLALSAESPDSEVALALERAALSAQRRGATDAAASLLVQAAEAVPRGQAGDRRRLLISAGEMHIHAGSARRAQELIREALPLCAPGTERAEALFQLAESVYGTDGASAAIAIHREALAEPDVRADILAALHREMSWYAMFALTTPSSAQEHARAAAAYAEETDDPVLLMTVLDYAAGVFFHYGLDEAEVFRARGLELESEHGDRVYPDSRPSTTYAQNLVYADEIDRARPKFEQLVKDAEQAGDELGRCTPYFYLCQIEWRAGDWSAALRYAEEAYEIILQAERTGELGAKLYNRALIYAHLGLMGPARDTARESLDAAERMGSGFAVQRALGVLGFVELSEGHLEQARLAYERASAEFMATGVGEPGLARWLPDHIATLAALGDQAAAAPLIGWLEERGRTRNRTWAIATAARGRGQLHAASGRVEDALSELRQSVQLLESFGQPFELGRSLLALGATERRANERRTARQTLEQALRIFDELPAPLWAERARTELSRIGGRTAGGDELTPTERQVAELVAAGLTNKEVADRLFVAVRTVESNLSRTYAKLGVRSRTELAGRLRDTA